MAWLMMIVPYLWLKGYVEPSERKSIVAQSHKAVKVVEVLLLGASVLTLEKKLR
jgi:hypothetical protein